MRRSPTKEKEIYDSATNMVENPKTQLPVSGIGMQARKKALRELRVKPYDPSAPKPKAKRRADPSDEIAQANPDSAPSSVDSE